MKGLRNIRKRRCPFQIGERIRIVNRNEKSEYRSELSYIIEALDYDKSTLIGRDINGVCGTWIAWEECEPFQEIGWEWLRDQLPPPVVALFSTFDGLENLTLRHDLRAALLAQTPSLKSRVLRAAKKLKPKNP